MRVCRHGFCANAEKQAVGVAVRNAGIPTLALVSDDGALIATLETSKAFAMQTLTRMAEAAAHAPASATAEAAPPAAPPAAVEVAVVNGHGSSNGAAAAAAVAEEEKQPKDNPHVEPLDLPAYQLDCRASFDGLTPTERLCVL
jgi:hypothetical protein